MKKINTIHEMQTFLILWSGQAFSALGSAMTAYALVIWTYQQEGSALVTAFLMISSYTPYILLSIFAGALSDRWNKKLTMLVCDAIAAFTTIAVLCLLETGCLRIWHIYLINAISGLMNTVQQPASEVAVTKVLPSQYYQKVGGLRYLASSVNSILTPIITTAILGLFHIRAVIYFDLITFACAFITLALFVKIPEDKQELRVKESFIDTVRTGIVWLKQEKGIFHLMLFLAAINLTASMYNAAFPAMMLSRTGGSETVMGTVNAVIGISTLAGSIFAFFLKAPRSRIRVICNCLLFSMCTENFLLALGRNVWIWGLGGFLGWIAIPLMNTNLDVIYRKRIPAPIQGRVYSVRNALQFFTIPIGYFLGGIGVDYLCEPIMAKQNRRILTALFGEGKGSGAALFFFIIAFFGIAVCLSFRYDQHIWELEDNENG
ncbi:MAG: MFS transporter [Lachnospiraceae bacterium]|nr:MFS transporter [Lachnospiraceae bacterium]